MKNRIGVRVIALTCAYVSVYKSSWAPPREAVKEMAYDGEYVPYKPFKSLLVIWYNNRFNIWYNNRFNIQEMPFLPTLYLYIL